MKDAEGRMREIEAANGATEKNLIKGIELGKTLAGTEVERIKSALELASVVSGLIPKALPAGQ